MPVKVIPWMNVLLAKKKTTITGAMVTVEAAMSRAHLLLWRLRKPCSIPFVSVSLRLRGRH